MTNFIFDSLGNSTVFLAKIALASAIAVLLCVFEWATRYKPFCCN